MVNIRIVRMSMYDGRVPVRMCVRPGVGHGRVTWLVRMLVMSIVYVRVTVLHSLVGVLVLMPLAQVQPRANRHQSCPKGEERRWPLPEHAQRNSRPHKRRKGEVGARAGSAEMPEREHEQHEADSVAQKAEQERRPHARGGRPRRT